MDTSLIVNSVQKIHWDQALELRLHHHLLSRRNETLNVKPMSTSGLRRHRYPFQELVKLYKASPLRKSLCLEMARKDFTLLTVEVNGLTIQRIMKQKRVTFTDQLGSLGME